MKALFAYNWQVRAAWMEWCSQVPEEELLRERTGGMGSILKTLFHIMDVECSWIQALAGKQVDEPVYEDYRSLERLVAYNEKCRESVACYVQKWSSDLEHLMFTPPWEAPGMVYTYGEVMRHVLVHEIHHIGQLSIWARELQLKPVSANYIGREL